MNNTHNAVLIKAWLKKLSKDQRWCVLISADPDAMASASALVRIFGQRVQKMDICRINQITRPDNIAMVRYLHLKIREWDPKKKDSYTNFALVDSQPHHNPLFQGIPFSIVIDHHPLPRPDQKSPIHPYFSDLRPEVGAASTIMTQYLRMLRIVPSPTLATALLLGIRTDTASFERSGGEEDFKAYQWLAKKADRTLLRRVVRSEYLRQWLPLFALSFHNLHDFNNGGAHAWIGEVQNADLLVAIADFFTKVHGLKWIVVSGIVQQTVVCIFRGDGGRDIGRFADACFHDVGSAGGHKTLGRAEFPLEAIAAKPISPEDFILERLQTRKLRRISRPKVQEESAQAESADGTQQDGTDKAI